MLFPNGQRTIEAFIIQAGYLLDRFTINNEIIIYDIPVVQISDLLFEHDENFEQFKNN